MDFSSGDRLDAECFCFAFLCTKGHGVQLGGYEEDVSPVLMDFMEAQGIGTPEALAPLEGGGLYTDCGDTDHLMETVAAINRALGACGRRLAVFEDSVYCDCEYTVLALGQGLAGELAASWDSRNFEARL